MCLFSYEINKKNQIIIKLLGIKIKISLSKNRFSVWKRLFFTFLSKFFVIFDNTIITKRYKYIIPLGKNCELATNYKHFYSAFMDSFLYNWAFYKNKNSFIDGIIYPEKLLSSGLTFYQDSNMWECNTTHVVFHSNSQPEDLLDSDGNLILEKKEKEEKDFVSKISYLKEKSLEYYKCHDKKLYMFTYDIDDVDSDLFLLENLYNYFLSQNKNFDILLIIEKAKYCEKLENFSKKYQNFYIRFVPYYRENKPDTICYSFDYYKAWAYIFREFNYTILRKKTKNKLKSEK